MNLQLRLVLHRPVLFIARLHEQRHQALDLQDLVEQIFFFTVGEVANTPERTTGGDLEFLDAMALHQSRGRSELTAAATPCPPEAPGHEGSLAPLQHAAPLRHHECGNRGAHGDGVTAQIGGDLQRAICNSERRRQAGAMRRNLVALCFAFNHQRSAPA